MNEEIKKKVISEIESIISELTEEYAIEKKNSAVPGNPYVVGLGSKISGLRLALAIIYREAS